MMIKFFKLGSRLFEASALDAKVLSATAELVGALSVGSVECAVVSVGGR